MLLRAHERHVKAIDVGMRTIEPAQTKPVDVAAHRRRKLDGRAQAKAQRRPALPAVGLRLVHETERGRERRSDQGLLHVFSPFVRLPKKAKSDCAIKQ